MLDRAAPLLGLSVVVGAARLLQLRADVLLIQLPQVADHELLGEGLQEPGMKTTVISYPNKTGTRKSVNLLDFGSMTNKADWLQITVKMEKTYPPFLKFDF